MMVSDKDISKPLETYMSIQQLPCDAVAAVDHIWHIIDQQQRRGVAAARNPHGRASFGAEQNDPSTGALRKHAGGHQCGNCRRRGGGQELPSRMGHKWSLLCLHRFLPNRRESSVRTSLMSN